VKREMLRSLRHIAETIDAVMVAEGIEHVEDVVALRDLGLRYGQGYYMARPAPPFPRIKASVRRSIQALGERGPCRCRRRRPRSIPTTTATSTTSTRPTSTATTPASRTARGSAAASCAPGAAHAQPLAEALRALVQPEDEEPLEPAGPDDERSEETQPHRVPGWRERRAAASTPPASQRPLIDSLRQRDDEVAPAVENPPKGDLN
jgi:hypothetical protein